MMIPYWFILLTHLVSKARRFKNIHVHLIVILLVVSCQEKKTATLFQEVPVTQSNINFNNVLTQTSHFNIIEYLYFYNGGGVSAGDINNDGLVDLYFTANQLHNKLYLNKGNFVFEDITDYAGVAGSGNWKTGTTMADVNGDGFLDLYVCGVGNYKDFDGRNQLFINNQDLTFSDRTDDYGLAFQGLSTHSVFFDYDNDGDLDLYLLNHSVHSVRSYGHSDLRLESDSLAGDRLYRNELIPTGENHFTDVTKEAEIFNSQIGYGLGVGVSDLNKDGLMDIYVSNDFHENDYLYINQGDGTFDEQIKTSIPHGSRFSMGNDIGDINNDGLSDIVTLDMLPKDEEVIKTTAGEDPYDIYKYKLAFGYHHQFARNTLQLNHGGSSGHLLFSDIASLAGVDASDWSWSPLLADFNNDGHKDLFVSNGILTRPNDLDYINFVSSDSAQRFYGYEEFIKHMPSGKVPNVVFRNKGNLQFADVSSDWIGHKATLSNGAAYADLDNDGDLDLVVNNINEPASIFRNALAADDSSGWLQFEFEGEKANRFGIGTKVIVYEGDRTIYQEQMLSRGWQSSVSPVLQVGIGDIDVVDSVCIIWPGKRFQSLKGIHKNTRMKVRQADAMDLWNYLNANSTKGLLSPGADVPFVHKENDFNAFNAERLIPHMVSTQGPKISVGDVNSDGLDDFFVGGAAGQSGKLFIQNAAGKFSASVQPDLERDSSVEDTGSAFFDADGNGALDLLVASGGQEYSGNHPNLSPRLYLNDGRGNLRRSEGKLPKIFTDASCVRHADIDGDGDVDLFIGGRVVAKQYGVSPESFLLINDGMGNFSDETEKLLPGRQLGMVTDASWNDINEDGKPDLVLTGEWMPITILIQDSAGNFSNKTSAYGLAKTNGWWNAILGKDFDQDGDIDFVAGNLGLNSRLKASVERPVTLFAGDMDGNGGTDHLLTYFNGDAEHPFISRDQLVKQVPSFRREFLKYSNFRNVSLEQIIPYADSSNYIVNRSFFFSSVYLENVKGKFIIRPLPIEAQAFPIFSFAADDFDGDGNMDLLAAGNLYSVQPDFGRYDSGYGLMMLGDGKADFQALSPETSGFLVPGEARDIAGFKSVNNEPRFLVSRNDDSVLLFR